MKNGYSRSLLSGASFLVPIMFLAQAAPAQSQNSPAATNPDPGRSQPEPVQSSSVRAGLQPRNTAAPSTHNNNSDGALQEIVVTANKREERLNKVGITVTAITEQALSERNITTLSNIASVVPGFTFAQSNGNTPILTLRGIGFNSDALGSYPAVSVYNDQLPLPFPVLALHSAYDLERIEVLKGPQGTLFGENSTGGAINFIAAKPTSTMQEGGDISYGRFNDVQGNVYVSGPISETLTARIAGNFESANGWQISDSRPYDRNGKISYGAGRLIVDWNPSDRLRFSLNANGWVDKSQPEAPQFIGLIPRTPFVQPQEFSAQFSSQSPRSADWSPGEFAPRGNRKFYQLGLRSDFDVTDEITLTSLTSYSHFTQAQTQDVDGLPLLINALHDDGKITAFNQEIRLANDPTAPFRVIIGANYEHSKAFEIQHSYFPDNSNAGAPYLNFFDSTFQYDRQNINNVAGFGNLEYDVSSKLTVRAGVRYTHSRNSADLCTGDGGDGKLYQLFGILQQAIGLSPVPTPPGSCIGFDAADFSATTAPTHLVLSEHNVAWRGGLDYRLSDQTLFYATISRGYKQGSYPLIGASDVSQYFPVTQESVTAYEAGLKTDLFNRRVHLNAAGFYYDYKNKQVLGKTVVPLFGPQVALVNVPKSRVYGAEADLTFRPLNGLTLTESGTYLNTRIRKYVGFDSTGNSADLSGNRLPFAPKFSYNFDAEYKLKLASGGSPFGGLTVTGRSRQDTSIGGSTIAFPVSPITRLVPGVAHPFTTNPYATLDLRLGYVAPGDTWRVIIFGKNVLNKYYWNNVIDSNEAIPRYAGQPATYGVTFGFKFK